MLVGMKELLNTCKENRTAVPAFNVYNLETILSVNAAATHLECPVIFAFGEGYLDDVPMEIIASSITFLAEKSKQPMVLHLDHAKHLSTIKRAIACGFTSVMYDGSQLPLEENIRNTQKVIEIAHKAKVSVEGELGYLNAEDGSQAHKMDGILASEYTSPQIAQQYAQETGVDALAIAIGNAHGLYKGTPQLDFEVLKQIKAYTDLPLVLHGSSGIPKEQIQQAIRLGICKININTEVALAAVESIRTRINQSPEPNSLRYEKLIRKTKKDLTPVIEKYMQFITEC